MQESKIAKVLNTDVLVIGGGGAGVTAAIAAKRLGKDVLILSKGQVGNSGNTIMVGGSFAMDGESAYHKYGIKEADPDYTKEMVYESIVTDGFFLGDQPAIRQFVEESPEIVYEVTQWAERAGCAFNFCSPATWRFSGSMIGRALRQGLKETPVDKLEDCVAVELLKDGDKISGAVAYNVYNGEFVQINAKAVVMATGGYQPFSLKNTNSDMTGDGVAMAYRAGASISDMEFMLFLLTVLEPQEVKGSIFPMKVVLNPLFSYRALDGDGNEIKPNEYLKSIETKSELCKLMHIIYYGRAISEGKGSSLGGVTFEFLNTDEELDHAFDYLIKASKEVFMTPGYYNSVDLKKMRQFLKDHDNKLQVGLGNEYTVGGILIDDKMNTNVPGLFAAGECSNGVFGANRVADALVEMLVQGNRAGITASEYIANASVNYENNAQQAQKVMQDILSRFENKGGISAAEAEKELERISDEGLGFYRCEEGLDKAIKEYAELSKKLENITIQNKTMDYNYEILQSIQLKNRLTCSQVAAEMAKWRKESRGLHMRFDYPQIDNENFLIKSIATLKDGKMEITHRAPVVVDVALPQPEKKDFVDFILEQDMGLQNTAGHNKSATQEH